jgi:hypothetical protein
MVRKTAHRSLRLETWGDDLVAVTVADRETDVAVVRKLAPAAGQIALQILVDQNRGRMIVLSSAGARLAEVQADTGRPRTSDGVQLINRQGDLKLDSLRVYRWDGASPRDGDQNKEHVVQQDGTVTVGSIKSYDAVARQFVIDVDGNERRVDAASVTELGFATQPAAPSGNVCAMHETCAQCMPLVCA